MLGLVRKLCANRSTTVPPTRSNRFRLRCEVLESRAVPAIVQFTVNTTADTNDANPGDGLALDANGKTSLRAAVQEANALAAGDTVYNISFEPPTPVKDNPSMLTIQLTNRMDTFTANIGVQGLGWNVVEIVGDGQMQEGMFTVANSSTSAISGVVLRNGTNFVGAGTGNGGAVDNQGGLTLSAVKITACVADLGGAIANSGQLSITNCWLEGNVARPGAGGRGGGIIGLLGSTTSVMGTQIHSNSAQSRGGGVAVMDNARIDLQDTDLIGNSAGYGAGAYNSGGTFTMSGGVVEQNQASQNGGGLEHSGGNTTLTDVTIQNNTAGQQGGGIFIGDNNFSMTRGALQNNWATNGGGFYQSGTATSTFQSVTIQDNMASSEGGAAYIRGGSVSFTGCTFGGNNAVGASLVIASYNGQPTITVTDCNGIDPSTDIVVVN